ncbi:MAG: hypothetical protein QM730_11410 [Anaerolineales bacterium]
MTINKKYSLPLTLSLIVGIYIAYSEIVTSLAAKENSGPLFSLPGIVAVFTYGLLALAGITVLIVGLWRPSTFQRSFPIPSWVRWLVVAGLLGIVLWDYLYSPWKSILLGKWTQLIFAIGFTQLISLMLSPRRSALPRLAEAAMTFFVFLFPRLVVEIRQVVNSSLASRLTSLLAFISIMILALVLYHPLGERVAGSLQHLRERIGKNRRWIIVLLWLTPVIYHIAVGAETTILYANLRFVVFLLVLWITSFLSCEQKDRLLIIDSMVINFCMLTLVFMVDNYLLIASDYPFSLTWSEGNRFYDYSLVFGQSVYNYPGKIIDPYGTPGRYGLWGIIFLWKSAPIWVHRLWNMVLQIVPPFLYALFITKKIQPDTLRRVTMLWIALFFIVLAPLHPPFMLGSVIVAAFVFDESPVKRGLSLFVAASYLAISRWTWVLAPAAMAALIDLFLYYPSRAGNWFRRLIPTVILAALGIAPGLYINFQTFQSAVSGNLTAVKQPLLWYRLLPNGTLGPGVLLLVLLYTGPLLLILAWWMYSRQWKLDIWQKLAVWGVLVGFFAVGIVISTKIGGGGDLHNLDMYLVTLMLVVALGLTEVSKHTENMHMPVWATSMFMLFMLFSIYLRTPVSAYQSTGANNATTQNVLSTIRTDVETASQKGEVLFMDQRQLLTFGYLPAVPFVPEYEKKYMMDQAMANNAEYFKPYYQDLARQRFSLIVTEILQSDLKTDLSGPFSEENDAFVKWVSNPTQCFYEPIYVSKETNIMLMVPKQDTSRCAAKYLK